jgi:hypothetical protein
MLMTNAENPIPDAKLTMTGWGADGIASLEVSGSDRRTVLEAALRAILALAGASSLEPQESQDVRSAPIRGEGDDLALLFADLVDDLLDQADYFGAGLQDVTLDGLVRRDDGGFVAWGYASGTPMENRLPPFHLNEMPLVNEDEPTRIFIRASLKRGEEG